MIETDGSTNPNPVRQDRFVHAQKFPIADAHTRALLNLGVHAPIITCREYEFQLNVLRGILERYLLGESILPYCDLRGRIKGTAHTLNRYAPINQ